MKTPDKIVMLLPTRHMSLAELKTTRNRMIAAAAHKAAYQGIVLDPQKPETQTLLRAYATAIAKREQERAQQPRK